MDARATGLKLKRNPIASPTASEARLACSSVLRTASMSIGTSQTLRQLDAQALRRRQGGKHQFAVDRERWRRHDAELDGVIHFLQHVDVPPHEAFLAQLFGDGLERLPRLRALRAAGRGKRFDQDLHLGLAAIFNCAFCTLPPRFATPASSAPRIGHLSSDSLSCEHMSMSRVSACDMVLSALILCSSWSFFSTDTR